MGHHFAPFLVTALFLAGVATIPAARAADAIPLFGRFDHAFTADPAVPPFTDFAVRFTAPSGKTTTHPGFYDGGQTYRVRFAPLEEGTWKYATVVAAGTKGLADQAGTFEVKRSAKPPHRFLQHGPIRVARSGIHLEHVDGTPFFFLGDTVWNGPLLAKKDHWDTFLGDRVAKHFTAIQFVMVAPWRTAPKNAEGLVAFTVEKDITIHPEFYRRMDERMDAIESAGLASVPVLLWAWGKKDAGQSLPEADAIRLIRYQLARYNAHPVLWILNGDGRYEGETAERWKRIARAVFAPKLDQPDAYFPPVTLHPGGGMWPYAGFRNEKWLDVHGYQSSHSNSPGLLRWIQSGPVSKEWRQEPIRPYINLEPAYEGHLSGQTKKPFTALDVRQACYWSLLCAPVAGLTYGGHGIWSWQEVDGLPFDHPYTGMAKAWQQAKDLPGAADVGRMADLFTSLNWPALRPHPTLLKAQPGATDPTRFVAAARSESGDLALLYLPAGGDVTLVPTELKPNLTAEWFDPRTAKRQPAKATENTYTAPSGEDWVLVLK